MRMHHAHVKRKENPMNPITLQEFYDNPALRRRLYRAAARDRALAIRAGIAWLREHAGAWLLSLVHRPEGRWLVRLG
jgi:hypothetical protein